MAEIDVRRWNGSLVTSLDHEQLTPGDFSVLDNFLFDKNGLPTVRGGRRLWSDANYGNLNFRSLYYFRRSWSLPGAKDFLMALRDNVVEAYTSGVSASVLNNTIGIDVRACWASLRGWVVLGLDSPVYPRPMYWDGTAPTLLELKTAPEGFIVASHASRLWIVDRHEPSRIWFSEPFEPDGWKASGGAGSILINPGDGGVISALVPEHLGEMIIFKDSPNGGATYRLQGGSTLNFAVVPASHTLGAMHFNVAQQVGDRDVFFASRRGIHSLQRTVKYGDLESAFIDAEVSDVWLGLPDTQKMRALAVDDFTRDTWYLWFDSDRDNRNDRGLLFNYRHENARGNLKVSSCDYGADAAATFRNQTSGDNWLLTASNDRAICSEHAQEPLDEYATDTFEEFTWRARLSPIDAQAGLRMKSWRTLWLRYNHYGEYELFVRHRGDDRPWTEQVISLNPDGIVTPFAGMKLGEYRETSIRPVTNVVQLREGGQALEVEIEGTGSKTTLRGFKLDLDVGREDVTAGRWLQNQRTSDKRVVGS